ncbi:MAG TPA: hypothetical protein VGH33_14385, partial [Isosphaeraceae bacterium]
AAALAFVLALALVRREARGQAPEPPLPPLPGPVAATPPPRPRVQIASWDDETLVFPEPDADPLEGSGIAPNERDPFLAGPLMNLLSGDRWSLEDDPAAGESKRLRRQANANIRDPSPDTANFPNSAFTLPKGRGYLETSPLGLYGKSNTQGAVYQWEYLLRYAVTDMLEVRLFSNGLTHQNATRNQPAVTGYSPLAFDFKIHLLEENRAYWIPAMGLELYIQTTFGTPALNSGTQPSMNLLFDHSLPGKMNFEWNAGMSGIQDGLGRTRYQFSFQWAFQRQVFEDFDVFIHGFINEAALPRLIQFRSVAANEVIHRTALGSVPTANVIGAGGIWTVNDRISVFGSYNFGTTTGSPSHIALTGFAVAF